jgi:hypothetical protein
MCESGNINWKIFRRQWKSFTVYDTTNEWCFVY